MFEVGIELFFVVVFDFVLFFVFVFVFVFCFCFVFSFLFCVFVFVLRFCLLFCFVFVLFFCFVLDCVFGRAPFVTPSLKRLESKSQGGLRAPRQFLRSR